LRPKAWSCKHRHKVATASNFTMFYGKSEGKGIECFIAKTFPKRNNSPRHKYVMYFYLIIYFLVPIFYISVPFLRYSILSPIHFCPQKMASCCAHVIYKVPRPSRYCNGGRYGGYETILQKTVCNTAEFLHNRETGVTVISRLLWHVIQVNKALKEAVC